MQNYHRHTSYSNIFVADSACINEDYAKRAVELGHKILSSCEHGFQGYYYETYELAKKYNLKFVFTAEAYWVKNMYEKDRTNCHIILMAKNENGRRNINRILSDANEYGYYFRPRVDIKSILSLPKDDVVISTACIAGWAYEDSEEIFLKFHKHFGKNFFLEIQYHNTEPQKELNKKILSMHEKYGIEMIVGLDSHYIYEKDASQRDYVLKAKNIHYEDEDGWYMDYPDDDTVLSRFLEQGVFTKDQIKGAMDNSDICLTFDDIILNDDIKLPSAYPNKTREEVNKIYSKLITKKFKEYTKGMTESEYKMYFDGVMKEVQTYKDTGMCDYPLIDYLIVQRAIEKGGLITDSGRGCICSRGLVHTDTELKEIQDIKIGDYVIDKNGEFKKVLKTMEYDINEELIKITHLYGTDKYHPTIFTKDHKVLVYRDGEKQWIEAQKITTNDYTCVPRIKFEEKNHEEYIDLNKYNIFDFEYDDNYIYEYYPFKNNKYDYSPKEISEKFNVSKKIIEDFANGKKDDFPNKKGLLNDILNYIPFNSVEEYRKYIKDKRTTKINRFIKNDYTFGQFIGLMYGDGTNRDSDIEIRLAVNSETNKNVENRAIFTEIANRIGCETKDISSKNRKLIEISFRSKIFTEYVNKELFISEKGKDKIFNKTFFNESKEVRKGILNGLFLSDGSDPSETHDNRRNFDNTSTSLINAYKLLSLNLGEGVCSLGVKQAHVDSRGFKSKTSYKLRNGMYNRQEKPKYLEDDNYWYLPVTGVELLEQRKTKVYDMTVEDSHSYLLNNMIVHNSAVGYFTNTLCGFSKVDRFKSPIKLYPERFISKSRILETRSLPD